MQEQNWIKREDQFYLFDKLGFPNNFGKNILFISRPYIGLTLESLEEDNILKLKTFCILKLFSEGKKQCNDLTATPSVTEWQMSKLKPSLENHSI